MFANVVSWIILGLVAGFLVNGLPPFRKHYTIGTIGAGIVGAFLGGVLYSGFKIGSISSGLDFWALIMAIVGAGLLMIFIALLVKNEGQEEIQR